MPPVQPHMEKIDFTHNVGWNQDGNLPANIGVEILLWGRQTPLFLAIGHSTSNPVQGVQGNKLSHL